MKPLLVSFVVFVAVIFSVFLFFGKVLSAIAWLGFAGINAVVLRKLFIAPTYFEKIVLAFLESRESSVEREELLYQFRAETPNLTSQEADDMFITTLTRLEQRGLIQASYETIRPIHRQAWK